MAISILGLTTKSGGCTSVTINKPSGTSEGDLMLLVYACEDRTGGGTAKGNLPSGFTEIVIAGEDRYGWLRAAYKIASGFEGASYTISGLDKNICATLFTIRGHDRDNPIGSDFDVCNRGTTSIPSITPDGDGALIFQAWGSLRATFYHSNYANSTNPLTWTEQSDFLGNRDVGWCSGADGIGCAVATAPQTTAGATGNLTDSANQWYDVGIVFCINEGAAEPRSNIGSFISQEPNTVGKWIATTVANTGTLLGVE